MQFYKHENFWLGVSVVLSAVVLVLLVFLTFNLRSLYQTGELHPSRGLHRNYLSGQIPDPAQIEGWMTFSYINYIFKLPEDYLSQSLSIVDKRYPNLEINQYAKTKNLEATNFLGKVQTFVADYVKGAH